MTANITDFETTTIRINIVPHDWCTANTSFAIVCDVGVDNFSLYSDLSGQIAKDVQVIIIDVDPFHGHYFPLNYSPELRQQLLFGSGRGGDYDDILAGDNVVFPKPNSSLPMYPAISGPKAAEIEWFDSPAGLFILKSQGNWAAVDGTNGLVIDASG